MKKIYIVFNDCQAGRKQMSSNASAQRNNWVSTERCEAQIKNKKRSQISPSIRRTQFPLALSCASRVHKVQGLSINKAVVDFNLQKQRIFNQGQMYTASSNYLKQSNNIRWFIFDW